MSNVWRPSQDSAEAAAHKRMAEHLGDFSLAPTWPELFLGVTVLLLAVALLVIWGPDAIEGLLRTLSESARP